MKTKAVKIPLFIDGRPELVEVREDNYPVLVYLEFCDKAGAIVDERVECKQQGRFVIQKAKDSPTCTPLVKFEDYAPETILTLPLLNRIPVQLGLNAAALAISARAMSGVVLVFDQEAQMECSQLASDYHRKLQRFIFRGKKSGLADEERGEIYRYND
jgi:hypothetical protein